MEFTKMHGTGNDFIIINNMKGQISEKELGHLAFALCNRKLSIGADGLMAVGRPECGGDFKMSFYNDDGSAAEMCGNGARCIARYGWENGLAGEEQKIETPSGMVYGWRLNERMYKIRLNDVTKIQLHKNVKLLGEEHNYSYVELGRPGLPHVIINVKNLKFSDAANLKEAASLIRHNKIFTNGTNVNFYDLSDKNEITLLTYERGVEDFTLACGTGAGATVAALSLLDEVSKDGVKVGVMGGELQVTAVKKNEAIDELYLTGLTCLVAKGEIMEEAICVPLDE
ncbi:MAG TPA: diaminopimelate epimerase [Anaerovoracaceae bacterium]|nr:diaminopimelate epimerase [Anaerovoracaceae bacterium]